MILPIALVLVVLSVPLTGGNLSRLSAVRLRGLWLILVAIGLQIAAANIFHSILPYALLTAIHLLSYLFGIAGVVLNLRHIWGLWVIALGGGMNAAAIAANDGVMPASPAALRLAGMADPVDGFVNSGAVASPQLAWMGDVFALPAPLPLANVFSVGDVILVIGFAMIMHRGSRPARQGTATDASLSYSR